jgi:hypothetical protein
MRVVEASEADVEFYSSVTGCRLQCPGIKNAPAEGYSPCGFFASAERSTIVFLMVASDPGPKLPDHPVGCQTPESWAREFLENPRFLSPGKKKTAFHRDVLGGLSDILGVQPVNLFRQVVYTNIVKCSPWPPKERKAPLETQRTCYAEHLAREIEYFWPLAIIAVGVAKDSSPTTFFENRPPKRSTGEKIPCFPLVHPNYGIHRPVEYKQMRAHQLEAIKRWYQDRVGKCDELAGENDPRPGETPNVEADEVAAPALARHPPPGPRPERRSGQVTDTTRIAIAARFNRQSAESCLDAVRAARVKCLTAGQELVKAQYDLRQRNGIDPTVAELIAAARRRYTPPLSQEDLFKFWRDYILGNIHRGIFEIHQ